ncbi:hypothetical protein TI01_0562 [Lysobacter sp. A03]|nr:hypothetical protein TI01_0562 [Lysobacter sp. A03]
MAHVRGVRWLRAVHDRGKGVSRPSASRQTGARGLLAFATRHSRSPLCPFA